MAKMNIREDVLTTNHLSFGYGTNQSSAARRLPYWWKVNQFQQFEYFPKFFFFKKKTFICFATFEFFVSLPALLNVRKHYIVRNECDFHRHFLRFDVLAFLN